MCIRDSLLSLGYVRKKDLIGKGLEPEIKSRVDLQASFIYCFSTVFCYQLVAHIVNEIRGHLLSGFGLNYTCLLYTSRCV